MASITRYSPLDDVFDDFFKGFFVRPVSYEGQKAVQIRMDVAENDDSYTVRAEIPGVKKDDINVTIDGNRVAISAEVKSEKDVKNGEKALHTERYYGKVSRAFSLAQEVDEESAQAKYNDGVLELTLRKKAAAAARRLAIQ